MKVELPLSLKYRPKKLSEVIGQPIVTRAFKNAFKSNTLHHAYILAGSHGSGKTTVARIIAAMENCKKGGQDPCGQCSNCKEIFEGKSYEVIEMDAGSGGGVESIRELHKGLSQCPVECKTKYVILDEAHSLTPHAAEASLKMIEEPPPFVRFILATTEPQAFKPTILSRCILWKFNKVPWPDIFAHLKNIAQKEKLDCEEKALQTVAKHAKGSVRDSLQFLQTIINYAGDEKITLSTAIETLGAIDDILYFSLINGIIKSDYMKCFQIINEIFKDGKDAKIIFDGVYNHLNNLLLIRTCKDSLDNFDFTQEEIKQFKHQNSNIKNGSLILKMQGFLSKIAISLSYSINPEQLFNKFAVESSLLFKNK